MTPKHKKKMAKLNQKITASRARIYPEIEANGPVKSKLETKTGETIDVKDVGLMGLVGLAAHSILERRKARRGRA